MRNGRDPIDESSPSDEDDGRMRLSFGRDDRVRISIQRPSSMKVATGLFGNQTRRSWGSVFVIANGHPAPQTLELIDAAPVSHDESVKVVSNYDPAPAVKDWQHRPGVVAWTMELPPNQVRQLSVSHKVTYPKDVKVLDIPGEP